MTKNVSELPDDIEVIGPGQMLADARQQLKLSTEEVAEKLNFRVTLVEEIEQEKFDKSLPDTFNRGYLKNYAKLVGIDERDILASYEMLGVAAQQGAEMQSFSKITEKQAQHSRLMWVSYLILATLIASSVLYWIQDANNNATVPSSNTANATETIEPNSATGEVEDIAVVTVESLEDANAEGENNGAQSSENASLLGEDIELSTVAVEQKLSNEVQPTAASADNNNLAADAKTAPPEPLESLAVFTFAGDCWVNIHDGNGERIAWGIKKAGYVMQLKGVPPFKVTIGKPELVSITFDNKPVDMSKFNEGNIAKFTLPESL